MFIIAFIVILSPIILLHELGHFLMAKRAGVKVEKFSLGFGPKVFGFRFRDTEYVISLILFGGYVKMAGEDIRAELKGDGTEFRTKSISERMAIVISGPALNVISAILLFSIAFMLGLPTFESKIGVQKDSPAWEIGLRPGDRVIEVSGERVSSFNQLIEKIIERSGTKMEIVVLRGSERIKKTIRGNVEIEDFGIRPFLPTEIGGVREGYPAEACGLKKGDRVISINGKRVFEWSEMAEIIHKAKDKPLKILVKRKDKEFLVCITPKVEETDTGRKIGLIGITPITPDMEYEKYGIISSFRKGIYQTYNIIRISVIALGKLIIGRLPFEHLAGPLGIAKVASEQMEFGLRSILLLIASLSAILGAFNLLPIPVLDGGHVMFFVIEKIKGRPISPKIQEVIQTISLWMLICLITYITIFNDLPRFSLWNVFTSKVEEALNIIKK